jgi:glycosyltransferase involved in cell wall biosynthesis
LPAAVMAAKYNKAKVGSDAEDMHSGQFTSNADEGYLLNKYIEETYFGQTDYFTAASPLIAKNYRDTYPYLSPLVINNVIPKTNLVIKPNFQPQGVLKLLWFSQTVGSDRGLEAVIAAISKAQARVELHLLGHCSGRDLAMLNSLAKEHHLSADQLHFHAPLSPNYLLLFLENFDIGLASETASTLNRDICLTNKIFTYVQGGLAILASNTQAQALFMKRYPQTGQLYPINNADALAECLNRYANDSQLLYQTRLANYELGQTLLNWEHESQSFLNLISTTVS